MAVQSCPRLVRIYAKLSDSQWIRGSESEAGVPMWGARRGSAAVIGACKEAFAGAGGPLGVALQAPSAQQPWLPLRQRLRLRSSNSEPSEPLGVGGPTICRIIYGRTGAPHRRPLTRHVQVPIVLPRGSLAKEAYCSILEIL